MKTRLLAGLVAVALGGLTSCSNILEENGVINNVAESGMGELRINLVADGTLNTMTKADETKKEVITDVSENAFVIYGTTSSGEAGLGYYSKPMTVTATDYTKFRAEYKTAENDKPFAFEAPHYEGEISGDYKVTTGGTPPSPTINATLKNSVLTVNLGNLATLATIRTLQLQVGEDENPSQKLSLYENRSLINKEIFINAEQDNIYIFIDGYLTNEPSKKVTAIKKICTTESQSTESQKCYQVAYQLKTGNGSLELTLKINKDIYVVPLNVEIDPYK